MSTFQNTISDHKCMITGWGRLSGSGGKQPTILQQASITTRNNNVCSIGRLVFLVYVSLNTLIYRHRISFNQNL